MHARRCSAALFGALLLPVLAAVAAPVPPAAAAAAPTYVQVSTGESEAVAVSSAHQVYAWGYDGTNGMLCIGSARMTTHVEYSPFGRIVTRTRTSPAKVATVGTLRFTQAVAQQYAATGAGAIVTAVSTTGAVYSWGGWAARNVENSALGTGTRSASHRCTPRRVPLPVGVKVVRLAAGGTDSGAEHVLALTSGGEIYSWGGNDFGVLGDGTTTMRYQPVKVRAPAGVRFTSVDAADNFSLARASDGTFYGWGGGVQMGVPEPWELGAGAHRVPQPLPADAGVTLRQVASNGGAWPSDLGLSVDGQVYVWGSNRFGAFGNGTKDACPTAQWSPCPIVHSPQPVPLPAGVRVRQLAAMQGWVSDFAVTTTGAVYAWGANHGNLGDGTTVDRLRPVLAELPAGVRITSLAVNNAWMFALTSTGRIYQWKRTPALIG